MSHEYDDPVKARVQQRMLGIKRLLIHAGISLLVLMSVIFLGAAEVLTALPAAILALVAMFSLVGHAAWFGMGMMRDRFYEEELEREHQYAGFEDDKKAKRLVTLSEDGELVDYEPFEPVDESDTHQSPS